jgi:hypothetical protein
MKRFGSDPYDWAFVWLALFALIRAWRGEDYRPGSR